MEAAETIATLTLKFGVGIIEERKSFNLLCFVLYQTHCLAKHAVFQVLKLTLHIRPVGNHCENCMEHCDV